MGTARNDSKVFSAAALAVILGTGAAGLASPPGPSADAPAEVDPEAARRYAELRKQGVNLAYAGRIEEALEAWKAGYAIRPSYSLACDIGRLELLRRNDAIEGARWYTRCVSMAPLAKPNQPKELAGQLEEGDLRDMARSRVGILRVLTDEEATIEVDGETVGKAPLEEEVFVKPGAHRLAVSLGSRVRTLDVKLAPGEVRTVDLSLPPPPAVSPAPSPAPPPPPAPPPAPATAPATAPAMAPLPVITTSTSTTTTTSTSTTTTTTGNHAPYGPNKTWNEPLLYTGIAAGAVGLGVTIGFGAAALKLRGEEAEAALGIESDPEGLPCRDEDVPGCRELTYKSDRADAFTVVSLVGLTTALAGIAMTAFAIVQPHGKVSAPRVQAAFVAAPGGGGLIFTGRF